MVEVTMDDQKLNALKSLAVAHLTTVRQRIEEMRNQQKLLESEIEKLIQYHDSNLSVVSD